MNYPTFMPNKRAYYEVPVLLQKFIFSPNGNKLIQKGMHTPFDYYIDNPFLASMKVDTIRTVFNEFIADLQGFGLNDSIYVHGISANRIDLELYGRVQQIVEESQISQRHAAWLYSDYEPMFDPQTLGELLCDHYDDSAAVELYTKRGELIDRGLLSEVINSRSDLMNKRFTCYFDSCRMNKVWVNVLEH